MEWNLGRRRLRARSAGTIKLKGSGKIAPQSGTTIEPLAQAWQRTDDLGHSWTQIIRALPSQVPLQVLVYELVIGSNGITSTQRRYLQIVAEEIVLEMVEWRILKRTSVRLNVCADASS